MGWHTIWGWRLRTHPQQLGGTLTTFNHGLLYISFVLFCQVPYRKCISDLRMQFAFFEVSFLIYFCCLFFKRSMLRAHTDTRNTHTLHSHNTCTRHILSNGGLPYPTHSQPKAAPTAVSTPSAETAHGATETRTRNTAENPDMVLDTAAHTTGPIRDGGGDPFSGHAFLKPGCRFRLVFKHV